MNFSTVATTLAGIVAMIFCTTAFASVQDYQVIRLIAYQSECQLERLENHSKLTGPLRYLAICSNVSFYPDGVEVSCSDREDERSCEVLTRKKSFDQLDLLQHHD